MQKYWFILIKPLNFLEIFFKEKGMKHSPTTPIYHVEILYVVKRYITSVCSKGEILFILGMITDKSKSMFV